MSGGWALVSLALPPLATLVAWAALHSRQAHPLLVIGLNALMPGAGLAAARRPMLEVASGVVFSMICLIAVGGLQDIAYWVPIMVIGGAWGLLHTPLNPLTRPPPSTIDVSPPAPIRRPPATPPARQCSVVAFAVTGATSAAQRRSAPGRRRQRWRTGAWTVPCALRPEGRRPPPSV